MKLNFAHGNELHADNPGLLFALLAFVVIIIAITAVYITKQSKRSKK